MAGKFICMLFCCLGAALSAGAVLELSLMKSVALGGFFLNIFVLIQELKTPLV